jgi:hypothetical protein
VDEPQHRRRRLQTKGEPERPELLVQQPILRPLHRLHHEVAEPAYPALALALGHQPQVHLHLARLRQPAQVGDLVAQPAPAARHREARLTVPLAGDVVEVLKRRWQRAPGRAEQTPIE